MNSVDFRCAFDPALEALVSLLRSNCVGMGNVRSGWLPPGLPLWVLVILLTLLLPTLAYGLLASWTESEPDPSPAFEFALRLLLPVFVFLLAWFFCFSFVRRRMGMTRLVTCLTCLATFSGYPLVSYWIGLSLSGFSENITTAATHYWGAPGLAHGCSPRRARHRTSHSSRGFIAMDADRPSVELVQGQLWRSG